MEFRKIESIGIPVSLISLGTWAFGGDKWWGPQEDRDSLETLRLALSKGISLIDTAPIYGRGRSEKIIGIFFKKHKLRTKIILATKVGLSWDGPKILHNLKKKRIFEEVSESQKRLQTDYFDLYQVHWPDPDTPIPETAEAMRELYQKRTIRAVGVSNYSVPQMREFMKYCPLHSLQPNYSMFKRDIEKEIVDFCVRNKIAIITYAPLYSSLLTGKFFFDNVKIPEDINRKMKNADLTEPRFSINKEALEDLKAIAAGYKKTLSQLALNWNFSQKGITSCIVGMRNSAQVDDNSGCVGWKISAADMEKIAEILNMREIEIEKLCNTHNSIRNTKK